MKSKRRHYSQNYHKILKLFEQTASTNAPLNWLLARAKYVKLVTFSSDNKVPDDEFEEIGIKSTELKINNHNNRIPDSLFTRTLNTVKAVICPSGARVPGCDHEETTHFSSYKPKKI